MLNAEAATYLEIACAPMLCKEFRSKYESAKKETPSAALPDLLAAFEDDTDLFIRKAEPLLKEKDQMARLIQETDSRVIFCAGYRYFGVMMLLRMRSASNESRLPMSSDHALSTGLIDSWKILSSDQGYYQS